MRFCAAALLLAALLGCASPPPLTPGAVLDDAVRAHPEQHVVVTVRNASAPPLPNAASTLRGYGGQGGYRAGAQALQAARRIAVTHGLREVAAWPIEVLGVHCLVYALPPAAQPGLALAALRSDPDVESAQPLASFTLQASAYNDPYAGLQASLQDLDVPAAQQWSLGQGVRIAVVDTGIDTAHPDFEGRVAAVRDFVGDGQSAAESHGTAVAGLIAAVPNNGIGIVGIAPQATLLPFRACWSARSATGACNSFTLAQALAAAVGVRADIVNLSLGGPDDALLRRIVQRGQAQGMVFVGAVPAERPARRLSHVDRRCDRGGPQRPGRAPARCAVRARGRGVHAHAAGALRRGLGQLDRGGPGGRCGRAAAGAPARAGRGRSAGPAGPIGPRGRRPAGHQRQRLRGHAPAARGRALRRRRRHGSPPALNTRRLSPRA